MSPKLFGCFMNIKHLDLDYLRLKINTMSVFTKTIGELKCKLVKLIFL